MLASIQHFFNDFFYDDIKQDIERPGSSSSKQLRDRNPRLQKKRNNISNHDPQYYTATRNLRSEKRNKGYRTKNVSKNTKVSNIVRGSSRKVRNLTKYLGSIFSNNDETLGTMREAYYNMNISNSGSPLNQDFEYMNIKGRIEKSDAFKLKLAELKYDKQQLQKLRRAKNARNPVGLELNSMRSIEDDRIMLLKNENRLLKRDLKSKLTELELTEKRLKFSLKHNKELQSELGALKIQLNSYRFNDDYVDTKGNGFEGINLQNEQYKTNNKYSDTTNAAVQDVFNKEYDSIKDNYETLASLSPIPIDYSRYSES